MATIANPIEVRPLANHRLWLKFTDGIFGEVDLSHLVGKGIFKAWDTTIPYSSVHIDAETKAIAWNNQLELCPDSLYLRVIGKTFEEWKEESILEYAAN